MSVRKKRREIEGYLSPSDLKTAKKKIEELYNCIMFNYG